jgi:uncharacterized protein (DUF1499 family)
MKTTPDWQFGTEALPEPRIKTRLITHIILLLALGNLLVLISAPLARLYLDMPGLVAFRIFFYAILCGCIIAAFGALLVLVAVWNKLPLVRNKGFIIIFLGLLPAIVILMMLGPDKLSLPMIHDISTDTDHPPQFVKTKNLRTASDNPLQYGGADISSKQLVAYPDIKPIISILNRDAALDEAVQVTKDLGWEFTNIDFNEGIIEAYDTTRIFGFIDDIVIQVRREGTGSRIDIRSASRMGQGDLGKNAERVRLFIRTFRD